MAIVYVTSTAYGPAGAFDLFISEAEVFTLGGLTECVWFVPGTIDL
jgi:hypothetical protein